MGKFRYEKIELDSEENFTLAEFLHKNEIPSQSGFTSLTFCFNLEESVHVKILKKYENKKRHLQKKV